MGFGCGLCCVCGWVRQGLAVGFLLLQYSVVYAVSPYVCFISFLFLDLYFLVDDASMRWGYLVQTKHLFVLIHFRIKGEVGTVKHFWALQFFTDYSKVVLLLWIIFVIWVSCQLCCLVCSLQPCGHLLGKGWPLDSLNVIFSFVFVTFLCGFLGQVWHLIVSVPALCFLPYFVRSTSYLYSIIMITGDYM